MQQQILMSGSVRNRVMALGPLVSKKKERNTENNGKRRKKGLEEKGKTQKRTRREGRKGLEEKGENTERR